MFDSTMFIPKRLRDEIIDLEVTYHRPTVQITATNVIIEFGYYSCVVEDKHGIQAVGVVELNATTPSPEFAYEVCIGLAIDRLEAARSMAGIREDTSSDKT